jgi:hypothetical protein
MGVVDVYVRVFCVYPVSELTWIAIYDYGEVVLPHGLDNCVQDGYHAEALGKVCAGDVYTSEYSVCIANSETCAINNYVILLYNNLSRDVLAKRVGNVLRSCQIGAS